MKKRLIGSSIVLTVALNFTACATGTASMYDDSSVQPYEPTSATTQKKIKNGMPAVQETQDPCCTKNKQKCNTPTVPKNTPVLTSNNILKIRVVGQGVAPCNGTCSPAQAYAMAKRAAIADAYRLIAEKVKGVYVEGEDYIKNMMVKRSTVKTYVQATVRNANVVETTFKDGLCEVEMEISLSRSQFPQ